MVSGLLYQYKAKLIRVVDGDTIDFEVDLGFRVKKDVRVRLVGVNTPEIYSVKKDSEEYQEGMKAKQFVENWIENNKNEDGYIRLATLKGKTGKYGRWLADVGSLKNENLLVEDIKVAGFDKG